MCLHSAGAIQKLGQPSRVVNGDDDDHSSGLNCVADGRDDCSRNVVPVGRAIAGAADGGGGVRDVGVDAAGCSGLLAGIGITVPSAAVADQCHVNCCLLNSFLPRALVVELLWLLDLAKWLTMIYFHFSAHCQSIWFGFLAARLLAAATGGCHF